MKTTAPEKRPQSSASEQPLAGHYALVWGTVMALGGLVLSINVPGGVVVGVGGILLIAGVVTFIVGCVQRILDRASRGEWD